MTNKAEPMAMGAEKKRLQTKQSTEKKKPYIEAFYSAIWPVLHGTGWTLTTGDGGEEGATYFLPPGITLGDLAGEQEAAPLQPLLEENSDQNEEEPLNGARCGHTNVRAKSQCTGVVRNRISQRKGKRLPKPYFSNVRDVIEKVLKKENATDIKAADAYLDIIPNANNMFAAGQKDNKSEPSRSHLARRNHIDDSAWKDERIHYEKSSSRVGPEFQVDLLPAAGSYVPHHADIGSMLKSPQQNCCGTSAFDGGALYERVWDPEEAERSGKMDFVHTRVKFNRKESAYVLLAGRGYRLPGFYQEVSCLSPTDSSDWTKKDRDGFRAAVFEHHENMKAVSTMIGKPISECITYYIVKFKRTKSYKSLTRSMKRKANETEGSGTLVCNACGKGGMLIACDTCEAHYHLACASPPLQGIPDGTWFCGSCKRETRSMLSQQDEASCDTDKKTTDESLQGDIALEDRCDVAIEGPRDDHKQAFISESILVEGLGNSHGHKGSTDFIPEVSGDSNERKLGTGDIELELSGSGHKRKKLFHSGAKSMQEDT